MYHNQWDTPSCKTVEMWNGLGVTGSDCWGVQGNDASIICQDVFCWIIWAHFLMVRREHTAICIWLLYETLSICKARWETQKGLTKEDVFRCAMCFQSVYPSSPETWTQPQQQSWCNQSSTIAHLSLPLHSLWENRNVKCPASAASGKNHSMFTNHIWNTGSQLWRNPSWPFSAELEAAAPGSLCLSDVSVSHASHFLCSHFCALETEQALTTATHEAFHSSAAWQCRFLF